ncbi:DNA glycosylase [Burkholderia pseudomallei]|uniref:UdgX family uracil-DNA binding protein n=1 Tax=Burkholderia pseudomallei TaxID=28450 RepID=UPI000415ECE3|nr:UdgX family uracil-DNA binding protein [Burkholderia pseudomallei]AIP54552.1 uracil-DNA glycosylase, 4 family protein [Burkholderia pseudomallei HBPUB10134a]CAJ4338103.1 DNA glycosylase [Burkholderia pseudomallei]CAJ4542976.1 DNA glycosylase [Burkholderia pseudomallei]CAJ4707136.1 DNA glycosylase [Burkholderia pseudomallei]CAJ5895377.1 DNA glycosylase [Burkholderia pseudomallei]
MARDARAAHSPRRRRAADDDDAPQTLDACRRCGLWEHATQAVPGAGPPRAAIMLVGEQPGNQEDREGAPFVGPAGRVLERALAAAGLDRASVYVTNAVKHFKWAPRGKRRMHKTPAQQEIDACRYWLERELDALGPRVVVALGAIALKAVLDNRHARLQSAMGVVQSAGGRYVIATYHPSFVLRVPDPDARKRAYAAIVEACRIAHELAQRTDGAPRP